MPYSGPSRSTTDIYAIPRPDPGRHYRWISDDPRRLGMWLRAYGEIPGYTLEIGPEACERLGFSPEMLNEKKRIAVGFNVLASIPIAEYERRVREKIDDMHDKLGAVKDKFAANISEIPGAKPIIEDPETMLDKRDFNKREPGNRVFVARNSAGARGASRDTGA